MQVTVLAHAKVNLDLRVLGVRPDGFHELRTVFQTIGIHDRLTFRAQPGPFALRCRHRDVPCDRRNLVWQAADLLWRCLRRDGEPRDVVAVIDKRIPLQAGLGGGSADAAAALAGLSRLWGYSFTAPQLREVAACLGSDVPFFLWGGTALGLGRGDEIYPLVDLPSYSVVVGQPRFGVNTRDAYAWYEEERTTGYRGSAEAQWLPEPWPSRAVQMVNDLEPAVARHLPEIGQLRKALRDQGAVATAMTGSGSAVFGLFRRKAVASAAARALTRAGWRAILSRTIGREEHLLKSRPRLSYK